MTGTQIHESLHAVGEVVEPPVLDRVAFQQQVRVERRRRTTARVGVAGAVAAAAAVVAATTLPFLGGGEGSPAPATSAPATDLPMRTDLETPVWFLAGGTLSALDPQGGMHDLDLRSEDVIGYTSEFVYAIGPESEVVRYEIANSDEGPGGPWTFERHDSGVVGPVQGAQLSGDGRFLAWIDLDGRLIRRDLLAGRTDPPVDLPTNSYLADVAQGAGRRWSRRTVTWC